MTLHWFSNKKNSEQSMAAYAAQAQRSKPTQGSTASMQPFCQIKNKKMNDKKALIDCLNSLKIQLERICNSNDFDKNFRKHRHELRRITAEVVHRTNNVIGEHGFVNENFKNKFRNESILGIQFGNHKNDFHLTLDNLRHLITRVQSDTESNYKFDKSYDMKPAPARFAIPFYLITIVSVLIFNQLNTPWYFVIFVFVSSALLISLVALVELRNNNQLSESNFFTLFLKVLKSILTFGKSDFNS